MMKSLNNETGGYLGGEKNVNQTFGSLSYKTIGLLMMQIYGFKHFVQDFLF